MPDTREPIQPDPRAVLWTPQDAGAVRYTVRHLKPSRRAWKFTVLLLLLFLPIAVITGILGQPLDGLWLELAWAVVIVVPILLVFSASRVLVCERALVFDRMARRSAYVVPYATIDPATPMIDWRPAWGAAYKYKVTGQPKRYPWTAMGRYVAVTQSRLRQGPFSTPTPLNVRRAPYSRCVICVRGLHPVLASLHYRGRRSDGQLGKRAALVVGAWEETRQSPTLLPVTTFGGAPVMRWLVGTDQPAELLRELEQAMIAAGFTHANGLTAHALARPYEQPARSIPADPGLW
jgi:hypothetical protein